MTKLFCVVLISSLLLATLAVAVADASAFSRPSSLGKDQALLLDRKGRELGQAEHQSKHTQQQPEEMAMEVQKLEEEGTAGWTSDQGEDAKAGLIYSADYSGVAMHAGSPPTTKPKHKHPKP